MSFLAFQPAFHDSSVAVTNSLFLGHRCNLGIWHLLRKGKENHARLQTQSREPPTDPNDNRVEMLELCHGIGL